jgi:succinyl-CoA synthetase beta subunit
VLPLDCKMSVDDNALYRRKALAELRDDSQIDAKEAAANAANVNYVALSGNIGCMVNGAGLAMATMDLIQHQGGTPANFLDVGGGATPETRGAGLQDHPARPQRVRAVLINIFGGIVRCDVIAEGIIQAVKEVGVKVPVIVRLEGTNAELGRKLLAESGLAILAAESLTQAARWRWRRQHEHPRRQRYPGDLPGLHRQAGHLPFRAGDRLRHADGRRRDPGQGRADAS